MQKLSFIDWFSLITGTLSFFGINFLIIVKYIMDRAKHIELYKAYPQVRTATFTLAGAFLLSLLFYVPWSKFHYGEMKQTVKIVYRDTSLSKNTLLDKDKQALSTKEMPTYHKDKNGLRLAQVKHSNHVNKKVSDTAIKSPNAPITVTAKNAITGGTFSAPVHNGDTFQGIKQRELTEADFASILAKLPKDKSVRISFTQTATGDEELLNYGTQILRALYNAGYTNLNTAINTAFAVQIKFGQVEVENQSNGSTIVIHPQSNVQK